MVQSRIEVFAAMTQDQPDNEMIWYGLASEYIKESRWAEASDALRRVVALKADYTAAYQLLGTALQNQGDTTAARQAWTDGIAVAQRTGAWKAQQHMQGLLDASDAPESGFCVTP